MLIKNALVYTENHTFEKKDIRTGQRILQIANNCEPCEDEEVLNGEGLYAIPGLVDIHLHGAMGADVSDGTKEGLHTIAEYEAAKGILAICPATMTLPIDTLQRIIDTLKEYENTQTGADLVGIRLEGPFLSKKRLGAQAEKYILEPKADTVKALIHGGEGIIKILDVAPEEIGESSFYEACEEKVMLSMAHTDCDYKMAKEAFKAGFTQVTHLFNAMPGIHHRNPGPIIAAQEEGAMVELISDGIHVHPAMVRFTFCTFGEEKVILISDSMRATGLSAGEYTLGGQEVCVSGNKAQLKANPDVIAGSVTNLYDCMKYAIECGVPKEAAVRAASENPAVAIGIDKDYGRLKEGCFGNILLVDEDFNPVHVIKKGKPLAGNRKTN